MVRTRVQVVFEIMLYLYFKLFFVFEIMLYLYVHVYVPWYVRTYNVMSQLSDWKTYVRTCVRTHEYLLIRAPFGKRVLLVVYHIWYHIWYQMVWHTNYLTNGYGPYGPYCHSLKYKTEVQLPWYTCTYHGT